MTWADVHLDKGVCELAHHKTAATGGVRTLYLGDEAAAILREVAAHGIEPGPVFKSSRGTAYTSAGLRSILKRHGGIGPYTLRHTYAQRATAVMPVEVVAALLGHADTRTTSRYFLVKSERAAQAAKTVKLPTAKAAAG